RTLTAAGWSTQGMSASANLAWENHHWYSFEFLVAGSTARWSIDDRAGGHFTVDYATLAPLDLNAVVLRMAARPGSDRASLEDVSLDGNPLSAGPLSWTPGVGESADRWWGLSGLPRD